MQMPDSENTIVGLSLLLLLLETCSSHVIRTYRPGPASRLGQQALAFLSGIRAICNLACLSPGLFHEIWETNVQNGALGMLALTPHCSSFSTAPYFLLCFPHTLVPYTAVYQCPVLPSPTLVPYIAVYQCPGAFPSLSTPAP